MTTDTATDADTGTLTINGILDDDLPYRTRNKYTEDQQEEIRYITLRALKVGVGALRPDLVNEVSVSPRRQSGAFVCQCA